MLRLDNSALLDLNKVSTVVVLTNNEKEVSIHPTSKLLKIKPGFIVGYNFYSHDGVPVKQEDVLTFNKDQLSDDVRIYVFQGCATKPIELFPIIKEEEDKSNVTTDLGDYIGLGLNPCKENAMHKVTLDKFFEQTEEDKDDDVSGSQYIQRYPIVKFISRGQTIALACAGDGYFMCSDVLRPNNAYEIRFFKDTAIFEQTIKAGEPLYAIYGRCDKQSNVLIFTTFINDEPQGFVITPYMGCTIMKCVRE